MIGVLRVGGQVADLHVFRHAAANGCHGTPWLEWDVPLVEACPALRNVGFAASPGPEPAPRGSAGAAEGGYPPTRPPVPRSGLVQPNISEDSTSCEEKGVETPSLARKPNRELTEILLGNGFVAALEAYLPY